MQENSRVILVNKVIFCVIFLIGFGVILSKAFILPITHDETATAIQYTRFSVWEIMMFPDPIPNNHILNTLLIKFFTGIFGMEQWAVRLPSLLSFWVFGWAVYRITQRLIGEQSPYFLAGGLLFFTNPYLNDFFSLGRGYALSTTLVLLSLSLLIKGMQTKRLKDLWWALIISMLATYANMTAIIAWASMVLILLAVPFIWPVEQKIRIKFLVFIGLAVIGFLALIALPIYKMNSTDQFQFWTSQGIYKDTFLSLIDHWRYKWPLYSKPSSRWFALGGGVLLLGAIVWSIHQFWTVGKKAFGDPLVVTVLFFFLTVQVNIYQITLLSTPNLSGRTALFLYPMFAAVVVGLIGQLSLFRISKILHVLAACSMMAGTIYHVQSRTQLYAFREWWFDANTLDVLHYLEEQPFEKPLRIKTRWEFHPSFYFYCETGKADHILLSDYDKELEPTADVDYYYVFDSDRPTLEPQFEVVQEYLGGRVLMKRKLTDDTSVIGEQ
ncbi:MAG: glycosyltransferase family 39 protein [Saprospiraceae bacterium]|nr:glycosyltransferase family 39 protein [Saprospiraceae bacterium]